MMKTAAALVLLLIALSRAANNNLFDRLDRIEAMLSDIKECSCGDGRRVVNCADDELDTWSDGSSILDANFGSWPANTFCRMIDPTVVTSPSYEMSVDLYNYNGWLGIHSGHLGLAYNYQDDDNYEAVYIRIHNTSPCYQLGQVVNGVYVGTSTGGCSTDPQGREWFNLRVRVTASGASVYLDGNHVINRSNYFGPTGRGGVIVANGYANVVHFRDFSLVEA